MEAGVVVNLDLLWSKVGASAELGTGGRMEPWDVVWRTSWDRPRMSLSTFGSSKSATFNVLGKSSVSCPSATMSFASFLPVKRSRRTCRPAGRS